MEPKKNVHNFPPSDNCWVPIDELHIMAVAAVSLPLSLQLVQMSVGMEWYQQSYLAHLLLLKVDDCP